jgi:hypothetical protein
MSALKIRRALKINVKTHALELVVKMLYVKYIITFQCVDVHKE